MQRLFQLLGYIFVLNGNILFFLSYFSQKHITSKEIFSEKNKGLFATCYLSLTFNNNFKCYYFTGILNYSTFFYFIIF